MSFYRCGSGEALWDKKSLLGQAGIKEAREKKLKRNVYGAGCLPVSPDQHLKLAY